MRPEQGFKAEKVSAEREDQLSVIMIIDPKQALGVHFHEPLDGRWGTAIQGIRTRHGTTEQINNTARLGKTSSLARGQSNGAS
jgi:hypothetical protein